MKPRTRAFLALMVTAFAYRFAEGINRSVVNNFYVEDLHLGADQMGLLTTARELPGFLTALVAALTMGIGVPQLGALSLGVMSVGFGGTAFVQDFGGLIAISMVGSLGFHSWMPILNALGLSLADRTNPGQVLGRVQAVGFAGALIAMGLVAVLVESFGYRAAFAVSGVFLVVAAVSIVTFPRSLAAKPTQRIVFRRRYWLYYAMTFLDGCRAEVFMAFGVYLLVRQYHVGVTTITLLLMGASIVSMLLSQPVGRLIDRVGERKTLTFSYSCHFVTFLGFAFVPDATAAIVLYFIYNVVMLFSMATNTYLKRTADPGDVQPSLAMGMTTMHISAMIVPILGGMLWERFGFQVPFIVGAGFIVISLFVSQMIPKHRPQEQVAAQSGA